MYMGQYFYSDQVRFAICLGLLRYLTHLNDYLYDIVAQEACQALAYVY